MQLRPERRPGYDLTFSAPKGISLLWAFGPDPVRDAISIAHDRAVGAVLDRLSTEACYARRGAGGRELIEAEGFIGAAFRHRTSRAGDPQLHTHVVVPNLVHADGRWSAPDGRHLFTWKMTGGALYRSALRAELAPLSLAWHVRHNGLSELRDIPKAILRAFSKRRADIEQAMEQRGTSSAAAAGKAALATRERKPAGTIAEDVLRTAWTEQLSMIEIPDGEGGTRPATAEDLTAALGQEVAAAPGPEEADAVLRVLAGEHRVSVDDWDLADHDHPDPVPPTPGRSPSPCSTPRSPDERPSVAWPGRSTSPRTRQLPLLRNSSSGKACCGSSAAPMSDRIRSGREPVRSFRLPVAIVATRRPNCLKLKSGSSPRQWNGSPTGRPRLHPPWWTRSFCVTLIWTANKLLGCGPCSPRATDTTWSWVRLARGSPPCSLPPGWLGTGRVPGHRHSGGR